MLLIKIVASSPWRASAPHAFEPPGIRQLWTHQAWKAQRTWNIGLTKLECVRSILRRVQALILYLVYVAAAATWDIILEYRICQFS